MSTARPPRLPRPEREAQILDVAHALFAARGYGAVTMDEVAAEVGVTKPLLYTYFGNKERLFLACVERGADGLQAAVTEAFTTAPDPGEALRSGMRAFLQFLDADRAAWQVLYDPTVPVGGEIEVEMSRHREQLAALAAAAVQGVLPAHTAAQSDAMAHALLGAAEGLARWWLRNTEALTAAEVADLLITTVEPGIARRART
ncbi:TetR/AcrR family transcriptional regulator [Paraconexibacter sp.]|uniref:TetR/AcrR family transcriptional regulator n=1 Tax=Paraconexibacter sp. TaxID=2949640 RepID=UPI0035613046